MKFKFDVGDKVRVLDGKNIRSYAGGWVSDMTQYVGNEYTVSSRWEDSDRHAYRLIGLWPTWDERGLELVTHAKRQMEKITIYRDGNSVVAIDMRNGNKGVSRCHPYDKFDFDIGAKLAFDRLCSTNKSCEVRDKPIGVGDHVKIIDTGDMFSTNVSWVVDNVPDSRLVAQYAYDDDAGYFRGISEIDDTFTVRVIHDEKAYVQKDDLGGGASPFGKCYLIKLSGLKRV